MRLYSFTMTTMPHRPIDDDRILQLLPERLDDVIAGMDRRIAAQVDLILHDPRFQRLERAWRGLWFVVERTLFDENIRIDLLNCSKEDLRVDFEAAGQADKGGLHAIVYARAIGSGHEPYGAILANFEFGPEPEEIALLQPRTDEPPAARALEIAARELVVVEEASVITLRAYVRAAGEPSIRRAFESLLRDEVRHAAAGRSLVALIERSYPESELATVKARLRARLPEEQRHLHEQALARAVGGPGRELGAKLGPGDLEEWPGVG
ncbi:type VI secretion system contractile sheath large subunit [Sorangium sp. So ce296]|uniref:type VI secretion system contractile sheath domain-containing protein n=1 Tax=Sorangium sp. So ce296 TaxID=3133296 RepID=UPI003F5E8AFE